MYYKTGRYDPARNVIELTGTWTIPHSGVLVHARHEIQIESPERHRLVRYISDEPVPDTFKDGVEAVVDGQLTTAGVFEGKKIQAKCASKYEAEFGEEQEASEAETKPTA